MKRMNIISPRSSTKIERYGTLDDQIGDLYFLSTLRPLVVCLLHGGFWRMPYGRDQMTAIAQDLTARGFMVWNLEYRRLGMPNGGWPNTFEDVVSVIEHNSSLANDMQLNLSRLVVIGHSAGGQLALMSATNNQADRLRRAANTVRIAVVVGQAPIADFILAQHLGIGGDAIAEFLGGVPKERYPQYLQASPIARLPLRVPQLILHGTEDDIIPIKLSRSYTQAARAAGDPVEVIKLPGTGHMDYLDPSSPAHAALCSWLGLVCPS
jgi:acetyl esterase/lipase